MKNIVIISLFSFLLFSCDDSVSVGKSKLPENIETISISWSYGGGMMYFFEDIEINQNTCNYVVDRGGVEQKVSFEITDKQINELFKVFRDNSFDKITTYEEMVLDRGGSSIELNINGKNYRVSNAGLNFVKDKYVENYNAIEETILSLVYAEVENQKQEVKITIDSSIIATDYSVTLYVNDIIYYMESDDLIAPTMTLNLLNDNNSFVITYGEYQDGQEYTTEIEWFELVLEELPASREIILKMNDDEELMVE